MPRMSRVSLAVSLLLLVSTLAALAHWDLGDGHKMHWPQLPRDLVYPDVNGVDIAFQNTRLADDWGCIESGPVSEIHVWVSWYYNQVLSVDLVGVRIWSNNPNGPGGYPIPDQLLWERMFNQSEISVRPMEAHLQGWFDYLGGDFSEANHDAWHQINIIDIVDPFYQEEGVIYWLELEFPYTEYSIGWKVAGTTPFYGIALYWAGEWKEMWNPFDPSERVNLSFVIDGEAQPEGCWLCCPQCGMVLMDPTLSGTSTPDFDNDGDVDISDFGRFVNCLYGSYDPCCDFDCSGSTDISDFAIFAAHYQHSGNVPCHCP